ncbi:DUF2723 domain-containing protein [Pseudomonas typographi]|uniref:DUF2723 domain-containing protein n=1 Tax=Pseudomonas typographi TaxID=2715964 RepID=A0ABR7YVD6_9PSED|nr:DUF2723 domain-containing protein [Pseudomonas typographi]MBD1552144.1 DUF2723 domain-containing protein [Pseudomonas typographi]MBD1585116.1 DUF2723 domain-containing protein [Pseudomonas typographi]MBD1597163.1 DUF2723 domain-containing protein [Pseudomonas typographi]
MALFNPSAKAWPMVLLLLAVALGFWAASGPVQWMDNGQYLANAAAGQWLSNGFGPLDHPLFQTLTTLLYQMGGPAVVVWLNTGLLVPLAAVVFWLARTLGAQRHLAWAAAAVALLAHGTFWQASKVDIFLLLTLWVLLAYALHFDQRLRLGDGQRLVAIGLCSGLGASVHPLALLLLAPLYLQLSQLYRGYVAVAMAAAALGFAAAWPALFGELASGLRPIEVARHYVTGFSPLAPGSGRENALLRFDLMWHEKNSLLLLMLSLLGPQVFGLLCRPACGKQRLLWWALWLNVVGVASYNVFDRFTYFVPGIALACILGVLRLDTWLPRNAGGRLLFNGSLVAGPLALLAMWMLYAHGWVKLPTHAQSVPYRDDIHYLMVPYLRDTSAADFAAHYERATPAGALIVSDETPLGALRSGQAAGLLKGWVFEPCGAAPDIGMFLKGPGAYLARTSYCERIVARYRLDTWPVGYRLQYR